MPPNANPQAQRRVAQRECQRQTVKKSPFRPSPLSPTVLSCIEWLEVEADGSPYHRARSMARRILRIYGYLYPVDMLQEEEERSTAKTRPAPPTPLFRVFPNPANQSVTVSLSGGAAQSESASIKLWSPSGVLIAERRLAVAESCAFDVRALSPGLYLIQMILDTGKAQTQRILISH